VVRAEDEPVPSRASSVLTEHCFGASASVHLQRCIAADFDGDSRPDVLYPSAGVAAAPERFSVFLSSSPGGSVVTVPAWPFAVRIAARDVDGDRDKDLVVTTRGIRSLLTIAVLVNDGYGSFSLRESQPGDAQEEDDTDLVPTADPSRSETSAVLRDAGFGCAADPETAAIRETPHAARRLLRESGMAKRRISPGQPPTPIRAP
jgi:hypothetical protein